MTKSLSIGLATLIAITAPVSAGPFTLRDIAAGSRVQWIGAPVPTRHPHRVASTTPDEAGLAPTYDGAPLPTARPAPDGVNIVGRIENGRIVPSASAYAASNEGPVASLFQATEAAATGSPVPAPVGAVPAIPVTTAAPGRSLEGIAHPNPRAFSTYGKRSGSLKAALDAVKADRYGEAIALRNGLSDPDERMIVDWFVVRAYPKELTFAMVADVASRASGWPAQDMIRDRAEAALARENPAPDVAIAALGGRAETAVGARLLARAYLQKGDKARATAHIRGLWQHEAMGTALQQSMAAEFGPLLTVDDHLIRAEELIGEGRIAEAKDLRNRLGDEPRAYLDAMVASASGAGDASARLKAVPASMRRRSGYKLAEAEVLRRADRIEGAAAVLESVPAGKVVNGDAYWVEARIVARSLAEKGDWRRAYKLAARGYAEDAQERADEAFHAGWFALTGLKDGAAAERHFATLATIATTPLSASRAAYWRGRAAAQRGDRGTAQRRYDEAAAYGFTYYGQLARAELGRSGTGVGRAPQPSAADRAAIRRSPVAQAVDKMIAAGHEHRIYPFLDYLAETVPTAGQAALVVEMGEKAGPHLALMAAKEAQRRGLPIGLLAYPTKYIPKTAKVPQGLDRAVVYAIARQESMFNSGAQSPVGAAGLMQVMPRTAAQMARELGLKHSQSKLTSDPAYNATLGAAYLDKRLGNFDGSYILTFAAYNAGAGRVREWIERFGDPRDPRVDPLTWVEQIPYPETRNYVQRVMENVQVYREALGTGRLAITTDLKRGRAS